MKKYLLLFSVICLIQNSCTTTKSTTNTIKALEGNWVLKSITDSKVSFDDLYPGNKPYLEINLTNNSYSGNNSCNGFSGPFTIDNNKINFDGSKTLMTMMSCPGDGDSVFMKELASIDRYEVSKDGNQLFFYSGTIEKMKFEKNNK